MADTKIASLDQLTTLDLTDEIAVVDKSDTTSGADGTTKRFIVGIASGLVGVTDAQTLTNKTLTSPAINTPTGDVATLTGSQTLTNKVLTSPVITTPQINDTSLDHQYVFAPSELAADRTVTLPLLAGDDTFVFQAFTQTLTNKTIDDDTNTLQNIAYSAIKAVAWTAAATPTYSASGTMTFTSVTTHYARYIQIGKLVIAQYAFTGTTGNSDSFGVRFTLPVTALNTGSAWDSIGAGMKTSGAQASVHLQSTTVAEVLAFDGSNWGLGASKGASVVLMYEAA